MIRFQEVRSHSFTLDGGLDLTSAMQKKKPGSMIAGSGVEMVAGREGYSRTAGYERCVDDVLPSTVQLLFISIEASSGTAAENDLFITGSKSFRLLDTVVIEDAISIVVATHDDDFAAGMVCVGPDATFTIKEVLSNLSEFADEEIREYWRKAIEQTRDNIPAIPGTELVPGGFRLRGKNYVFRDGKLYRGDLYAWTEIAMPEVLYFNKGIVAIKVGDVISDGTRTATVKSLTLESGAWNAALPDADKAKGYVTVTGSTGNLTGALTVSGTPVATVLTTNTPYVLPNGGDYQTVTYNFTSLVNNDSVFGASGVGDAFEFNGTDYIPIIRDEYPFMAYIHQERLQLFYPGGVWEYSVSGQPRVFNSLLGAGSYSTGSEIVGVKKLHSNVLSVFTEKSIWLLFGTGVYYSDTATRDWQFVEHDNSIGAIGGSIPETGPPMFVSGADIKIVEPTDTTAGYISKPIFGKSQPLLKDNISNISTSIWCHSKSQYRLFMKNGTALYHTWPRGCTPAYYPRPVRKAWSAVEDSVEKMFFVSDTGFLYRMDSGNTLDDEYIEGSFRVPFYHYGNNRVNKLFPRLVIEFDSPVLLTGDTTMNYTVNHAYGDPKFPRPVINETKDVVSAGGLYGSNQGYGLFVWGGPVVSEILGYLDGEGPNMSVLVTFKTRYDRAFTFLTATVDYINLGLAD